MKIFVIRGIYSIIIIDVVIVIVVWCLVFAWIWIFGGFGNQRNLNGIYWIGIVVSCWCWGWGLWIIVVEGCLVCSFGWILRWILCLSFYRFFCAFWKSFWRGICLLLGLGCEMARGLFLDFARWIPIVWVFLSLLLSFFDEVFDFDSFQMKLWCYLTFFEGNFAASFIINIVNVHFIIIIVVIVAVIGFWIRIIRRGNFGGRLGGWFRLIGLRFLLFLGEGILNLGLFVLCFECFLLGIKGLLAVRIEFAWGNFSIIFVWVVSSRGIGVLLVPGFLEDFEDLSVFKVFLLVFGLCSWENWV